MIFKDYYNIDILFNESSIEVDPQTIDFSIHDSINSFYSTAELSIDDRSGLIREYLFPNEGNIFGIVYGTEQYKENILKSNFIVHSNEQPGTSMFGIVSGKLKLNLIHEFFNLQSVENKAHKNTISKIIESLVSSYPWKELNIKKCESNSIWYQLNSNQRDFIMNVLIPNAYSKDADETPFFSYIDCNGVFNLKSYKHMLENSNIVLKYEPSTQDSTDNTTILDIKPFSSSSLSYKKLKNRNVITRNYSTGAFETKKDSIKDHPVIKPPNTVIPLVGKNEFTTSIDYYNFSQKTTGDKEALLGRILNDTKSEYFLEKYLIITVFNPLLKSGISIKLNLSILTDKSVSEYSLYQSGNYVIEECTHSWIGSQSKGLTQIIVSRKLATIPNDYKLKSALI